MGLDPAELSHSRKRALPGEAGINRGCKLVPWSEVNSLSDNRGPAAKILWYPIFRTDNKERRRFLICFSARLPTAAAEAARQRRSEERESPLAQLDLNFHLSRDSYF